MNSKQSFKVVAAVLAAMGLAACERESDVPGSTSTNATDIPAAHATVSPSAKVIGVEPAAPTGDPPGTTPVAANTSYVSQDVENRGMPVAGQPNDHSNLTAKPPQKAETPEALHSVAAGKANNSTEQTRTSP